MGIMRGNRTLPPTLSIVRLGAAMAGLGIQLRSQPVGYPISPERHGNANIRRIPHRHRQIKGWLPEPPEAN